MFLEMTIAAQNIWECILLMLGGLGIFLYGINLMGDSLKDLAGSKLKIIIEKSTNTPLKGILVGAGLTAIIQSSSGTTALVVGLVRSGLMTLAHAVGIIMGANIGTTITALIIGFDIGQISLLFVGIGAILTFFISKRKVKDIGRVCLGFGLLFFGLQLMDSSLNYLMSTYKTQTEALFTALNDYPIIGLLVGIVITAIIQSSSASIGILQGLFGASNMTLMGAVPILIGANIGTTVTAVLTSIGGGSESKRTALFHATFNILGAILFMILLYPFVLLLEPIDKALGGNSSMTLAIAHIIFNIVTTFVLFWFIKPICKVICKIVKGTPSVEEKGTKLLDELLDYSLIKKSPALALTFIDKCMNYMGEIVNKYFTLTLEYSKSNLDTATKDAEFYENMLDNFDKRIHDYLINITLEHIHSDEMTKISKYLDTIKDYERIGDHCSNICGFYTDRYKRKLELSTDSMQDLEQMFNEVNLMVTNSVKAINSWDSNLANIVEETESKVDDMHDVFHERHNHRVSMGLCSYDNSDYYDELLVNLERIGDHCKNIADTVVGKNRALENNFQTE